MRIIKWTVAGAALAIGLGLSVTVTPVTPMSDTSRIGVPGLSIGVQQAEAQTVRAHSRRVSRRTARRTTRRQSYIRSLPGGCAWRAPYHYCGGVYYQPVVQSGSTVYVVVTP